MSTQPWRGTLIFAGTLAAIAATAAARFSGSDGLAASGAVHTGTGGTSTGQSAAGTTGGSTGTSSGASGSSSATGTQSGTTSGTKTIVGTTEQTPYGPLQLSVTFTNGKVSAVQALQTPNRHGESVQINAYAVPILTKEAIAAGSANIDTVSGATFTSQAYAQSLQSAIDKLG
ncbi:hypothetical protein CELL_01133 [Cellulomonas sp. T2.31MG-18]|uniref:FMN-binding protein n=1 Tax=Cellulomonas sp. T2.31MG-18 TaxID=3157619 RepID=UPI0035EF3E11